jgi:hypothetical protein
LLVEFYRWSYWFFVVPCTYAKLKTHHPRANA